MVGQTIKHYEIRDKLGEGAMGLVYGAQDLRLDRPVALKFLPDNIMVNTKGQIKVKFLSLPRVREVQEEPR